MSAVYLLSPIVLLFLLSCCLARNCSLPNNACGNFSSCNADDNGCKCLLGFHPKDVDKWEFGEYSEGCSRVKPLCTSAGANITTFLKLKMVKLGSPDFVYRDSTCKLCMARCLSSCRCQAYSYLPPPSSRCMLWTNQLTQIEEHSERGIHLNLRLSDLGKYGKMDYPESSKKESWSFDRTLWGIVASFIVLPALFLIYTQRRRIMGRGPRNNLDKPMESARVAPSLVLTGLTVDKSIEFLYEELAQATDSFNTANQIGHGGFGDVYYAELRGEKAAIKKMDIKASKEFLAEFKVLTHVHHLNLVRLIGYCVEGSLFLVYEFIENGDLSQHLRGSARDPLSWSTRVQIALDAASGLEYIHEHTVPVYIHRDIKSANILIDKNYRAKVADFGLTKFTGVGSAPPSTRPVGTYGYMPLEYAMNGEVSPKLDVYAFGVVLYELISAKGALIKFNDGSAAEKRTLVSLFEDVLDQTDPKEDIRKLIDPRLGENYPLDSVEKMAQLAKACTQDNAQLRLSMRSVVVALMTLSSSTGLGCENQALVNLLLGI